MKIQIGNTPDDFKIYLDDGKEISKELLISEINFSIEPNEPLKIILTIPVHGIDIFTQK